MPVTATVTALNSTAFAPSTLTFTPAPVTSVSSTTTTAVDPAKLAGLVPPDAPPPGTAPYPPEPEKKGKKSAKVTGDAEVLAALRAIESQLEHIANLIAKACALESR